MEVVLESGIVSGLVNEQAGVLEFSTDSSLDQVRNSGLSIIRWWRSRRHPFRGLLHGTWWRDGVILICSFV